MASGRWWRTTNDQRPVDPVEPMGVKGTRREDRQFLLILVALLALAVLFSVLSPGNPGASVGVLVLVLIVVAVVAFLLLYRIGVKVPPLEDPGVSPRANEGGLARLAETLGRADRGMRFSQAVVARRVREAFLTRLVYEHDVRRDELEVLLARPDELRRIVRDPDLQAFLVDTAPAEEQLIRGRGPEGPTDFRFARREGFTAGIARVLEAMEEWH